jgi:hypothetical protein
VLKGSLVGQGRVAEIFAWGETQVLKAEEKEQLLALVEASLPC